MILIFAILFLNTLELQSNNSQIDIVLDKNQRETRGFLTYSLRFSNFSDSMSLYKLPSSFYDAMSNFNLLDSFKFKYYGYSTYPFRLFIARKKSPILNHYPQQNSAKPDDNKKESYYLHLSLLPLFDEIKENINYYIIDIGMKSILNDWNKLSFSQKKEFIKDIHMLNIPLITDFTAKGEKKVRRSEE